MADKLNIVIKPDVPPEIAANAAEWIEDIINWLLSQPVPADLSGTQPRFSEIEYRVHSHAGNYGLRNKASGKGWINLGTESDLKIEVRGEFPSFTELVTTPEIAFRGNAVYLISQLMTPLGYYKDGFDWERCLTYQLKYLDFLAENNRQLRGLLDDYEESQKEKEEAARLEQLGQQQQEKWHQHCQQYRIDQALRIPLWWLEKWPNSPQSKTGEFLVTQSGHPIGTSDQWRNGELSPPEPAPNVAAQQAMQPKEPQAFSGSDAEEEEAASWQRLYDSAMGKTTASVCEDNDM